MGFFNFDKEGPGISKDSPQKKGIFLFFELLGRKFGIFCKTNLLYFLTSLPMIFISFVAAQFFINYLQNILAAKPDGVFLLQTYQFVTFIFVVFLGSGPASAALAYFNRSAVREEAVYVASDFFGQFKNNLKQGMIVGILHPLLVFSMLFAVIFYGIQYLSTGALIWGIMMLVLFIFWIAFVFSGFYIYQLMVTFENSIFELYKNAFLLSLMNMPYNLLVAAAVIVVNLIIFFIFTPIVSLFLSALCWISVMRFAIEFRAARYIKKQIIDKMENSDK